MCFRNDISRITELPGSSDDGEVHIQRDPTVGGSLIDVHILLTNLHLKCQSKSGQYKVKGSFFCFVFFSKTLVLRSDKSESLRIQTRADMDSV